MAQSKRTAASYVAGQRNTTAGNPFMGKTMAEMKKMYSAMTPEQRGKNVETFRRAAAAAKKAATTPKVTKTVASTTPTKPKSAPVKSKSAPAKPKASDKAVKGGYTISPEKRKASTRGAAEQPKPKTTPRRGSGVKKTGKKVNLGKALQNLSDKFKLTRKAGEVFTVGNMRYVSDGKGGIRSSQRIR